MDWGLLFSVGSSVVLIAIVWGQMSIRVQHMEKIIEELKAEVKDFRRLSEDLAVVKHDINSIKEMISRILKDVE